MSDDATQPDEGEVVEGTATELETVPAAPTTLAVAPQVDAQELVARLDAIKAAQKDAMDENVDYGVIPGTKKPTLLKPGAEKLSVLFQLDVQLVNEKTWGPDDHLTVVSHATVFHAPTGSRLGYGEGVCTTRERKYAYRKQERVCPNCNEAAVIKGKDEYGGGWLCWAKRGGCNSKWKDGAAEIEGQEAGEIDNPDLPDLWNTVVKMAEKRARVDAVLAVTGASALFTQDIEDTAGGGQEPAGGSQKASQPKRVPPSEKQLDLIERLLKQRGGEPAELATARAYMADNLTGGKQGTASQTIELLKDDEQAGPIALRLVTKAAEWAARQSDVPADTDGLPMENAA